METGEWTGKPQARDQEPEPPTKRMKHGKRWILNVFGL